MKIKARSLWLLLLMLGGITGNDAAALAPPARRIISLAPHLTELLYAAGAGKFIVGVVAHSDYPPAARELPQVGDAEKIDLEGIIALQPDLIALWEQGTPTRRVAQLQRLGMQIYRSSTMNLEDIPRAIEHLGGLAGTSEVADRAAGEFRARVAELAKRYQAQAPLRVFYQIWGSPLITVGGRHFISQVITLCGGKIFFRNIKILPR